MFVQAKDVCCFNPGLRLKGLKGDICVDMHCDDSYGKVCDLVSQRTTLWNTTTIQQAQFHSFTRSETS